MPSSQRTQKAETRVCKALFSADTGQPEGVFGDTAQQWMEEVAFITATRFSRRRMVSVAVDLTQFTPLLPTEMLVEIIGQVVQVGRSGLKISVTVFVEELYRHGHQQAMHGLFTFVPAADDAHRSA